MCTTLPQPITDFVSALNAHQIDGMLASLSDDALVNDIQREFSGAEAIRGWATREIIGPKVTMNVTSAIEHYGDFIVTAAIDGEYDKTGLPDPLVLTCYYSLNGSRIVKLIILRNKPAT
jgi:hypothetical protein